MWHFDIGWRLEANKNEQKKIGVKSHIKWYDRANDNDAAVVDQGNVFSLESI